TGAFRPIINSSVLSNNQLQPPSNFLTPVATRTDVVTSNAGFAQRLPWFGTQYNVSWSTSHTNTNSFLSSYNPLLQSGLGVTGPRPPLRAFSTAAAGKKLARSGTNGEIAATKLHESGVHPPAAAKAAYWNLVSARANADARRSTLDSSQELA